MENSRNYKRILSIVFTVIFVVISALNAYSINIDGIQSGIEWDGASLTKLIDGESNSKINFGIVKSLIKPDENAVFLCFMTIEPELDPENLNVGLSLNIEDSSSFTITASETTASYDDSDYSFDGALSVDTNNGSVCEVRIGFKNGLPSSISASVSFIDSDGNSSNVYPFVIINDYYVETTEIVITEIPQEETTKSKESEKITKLKTTTEKEERTTDYTLKPKTTKPERTKAEIYIATSPPYSYVRKTKPPKTTKAPSTAATTKAKTTKAPVQKIYFYEKEVIISEVYVTEEKTSSVILTAKPSETTTKYNEIITESVLQTETVPNSFSLSKGTKYKVIIGAFAMLSFTAIAVGASVSSKKKSNKQ